MGLGQFIIIELFYFYFFNIYLEIEKVLTIKVWELVNLSLCRYFSTIFLIYIQSFDYQSNL